MRGIALSARDRRALRLGMLVLLPVLVLSLVVRPYLRALALARQELAAQRVLLARELGALRDAPRDAVLVRHGRQLLAGAAARLFDGGDAVAASAALAGYVGDQADSAGLEVQESETRPGDMPSVDFRARGDVLAIMDFLRAIEDGPKLARVEQLTITREPSRGGDDADGTLVLAATIAGLPLRAEADARQPSDSAPARERR